MRVLTYVEDGYDCRRVMALVIAPTTYTTRIMAMHAYGSTAAGSYSIKGQKQITNKTAEGTAIKFQVAANEATDIYMGELGVPVYGVVSVSGPTDGCVLTAFVG